MSGRDSGQEYNLSEVTDGIAEGGSVEHGDVLNGYCEAIMRRDDAAIGAARQRVIDAMGHAGMIDAAATIAAFNAYPRAADATGLPLEDQKAELTVAMREELGLDDLQIRAAE
jgi:hypothetical protein